MFTKKVKFVLIAIKICLVWFFGMILTHPFWMLHEKAEQILLDKYTKV